MGTFLFCLCFALSFLYAERDKEQIHFSSLSGNSLRECISFCRLYPTSPYLPQVEKMLNEILAKTCGRNAVDIQETKKLVGWMGHLQEFFNGMEKKNTSLFTQEEVSSLLPLYASLPNRKLKGYGETDLETLLLMEDKEIDIATAYCASFPSDQQNTLTIVLDFLAMQALEKAGANASISQKVEAINELLFFDLGYRYAPMSDYQENIDQYSLLTPVLHSRRGICMGTSLLWAAIAQRLSVPVEFVVPPGHIFPRVPLEDGSFINIETTARGIHIPLEEYASISAEPIYFYGAKGAIALLHQNVGSKLLADRSPKKAKKHFQNSLAWLPGEALPLECLVYSLYLGGEKEEAKKMAALLEKKKDASITPFQELFFKQMLTYSIDPDTIYLLFLHEPKTSEEKQRQLQQALNVLKQHPEYTSLYYLAAMRSLALHRQREGCALLGKYVEMHPYDPYALYVLTLLEVERFEYNKAKSTWQKLAHFPLPHCRESIEKLGWELDQLSPFYQRSDTADGEDLYKIRR
jgi:regulator of sirC expression with transglutaminase-like and TPR domain